MPIDTSIYANALRAPKSILEYTQEANAVDQQTNALKQSQMQLQQANALMQQRNALRDAVQNGQLDLTNPEHQSRALAVAPDVAPALLKTVQEGITSRALAGKDAAQGKHFDAQTVGLTQDQAIKASEQHLQQLPTVQTHDDAVNWAIAHRQIPGSPMAGLPTDQFIAGLQRIPTDPAQLAQWKQQAQLSGMKLLEQFNTTKPVIETRNTGGSTDTLAIDPLTGKPTVTGSVRNTQSPDSAASVAATLRGQNLTDARMRETTAATMTKPFEVTGPDGQPMLVQQDKQGNITPVTGYGPKAGSAKPLTDAQAKALGYGSRMQEADRLLVGLKDKYSPAAVNAKVAADNAPLIGGMAGAVGNMLLSDEGQQAEQAQRDFINAVLRRESGAAISESEFANARKQYFPQPNDKKGNLEQKARNRSLAIQGVLAEVPAGQRGSLAPAPASGAPNSKALSVSNW